MTLPAALRPVVAARYRNEALVLLGAVLAMQFFPGGVPLAAYASGTVTGAGLILSAIGLLLVFRASRIINFAQLSVGTVCATVFNGLVQGQVLLRGTRGVCSCVGTPPGATARGVNFAASLLIAIAVGPLLSYVIYRLFLSLLFKRATRLTLLLVTIFLGQALSGLEPQITQQLIPSTLVSQGAVLASSASPLSVTVSVGGFGLHLRELLLIAAAALAVPAVALFLRRSRTGVAVRCAADNPARAETLGVNVAAVTGRIWLIAGLLAGISGVISAIGTSSLGLSGQAPSADAIDALGTTLVLVCLVVGRFRSLALVGLAGLVLGWIQSASILAFSSAGPLEVTLVVVVGGLLLLQPRESGRAGADDFSGGELSRELRGIPAQLRSLPVVKGNRTRALLLLAGVTIGLPFALSIATVDSITDFFAFGLIGLSLLVLTGWSGQVSLGQVGFAAVGAWVAAVSGLPFPLAVLLAGLAGAAVSALIGIPALKLTGLNLAVSTLAFAVSATTLFVEPQYLGSYLPTTIHAPSLFGFDVAAPRTYYFVVLTVLLLASGALVGVRRSRTGRVLIAVRANPASAQAFGVSVLRARLTGFAVSGFAAAVAGALLAFHAGRVVPETFAAGQSVVVFTYTVIGGLGGLMGPLLGAAVYGVGQLASSSPLVTYVLSGFGGVLLLAAAPGGLAETAYGVRDAMLRRIAVRLRLSVPSLMGDRVPGSGDRAELDERKGAKRNSLEGLPVYRLSKQWALDRYAARELESTRG